MYGILLLLTIVPPRINRSCVQSRSNALGRDWLFLQGQEAVMAIVALILGILGGATGVAVAPGVDITAAGASLVLPSAGELMTLKMLSRVAGPLVTIFGVIVAIPKRMIGAAGMALTFEFNSVSAIPIVLSAAGAILAVYAGARPAPARA